MPEPLTMPPILYLPCFDYQVHRQRPQQLLYHLSLLRFNVIYCNVTQDREHPFVVLNDHFAVCQDVEALNLSQPYVMWLTHGPYVDSLPSFNTSMVISDLADTTEEEFAPFAVWEDRKIQAADIVLCASQIIYESAAPKHPQVHLVRNAADYTHFAQAVQKTPLPIQDEKDFMICRTTEPVIGFWGAVASWLDYSLIRMLAVERPHYTFVFIGQITCGGPDSLTDLPNVHWLGNREYESLPLYASHFDAAIIPFEVRKVTSAANPVKMYEYMAAGLPVISTDLPEVSMQKHVRIGRSPAQFLRHLDEALLKDRTPESIQARQDIAQTESWSHRAEFIKERIIEKFLQKYGSSG
ncbi:glycosyltransferase [Paenibacillus dokdonensis]|uniref:Glycosyltransferase n=1 Tax=Paenibacillus dokdonensis TaxID=2567944 RepID=A0ABU6GJJ3_9BACL|nr:glycosyltransferase [Paenibacillus dokdonensis]MEC0239564.1 glycosyltransferase [Paenibacillus dokdonensis]